MKNIFFLINFIDIFLHLLTKKSEKSGKKYLKIILYLHIIDKMLTKKSEKIRKNFICINCDYNTCDKKDYMKHINTAKHKKNANVNILFTNLEEKSVPVKEYYCECDKKYKSRQGLYNHKKKCNFYEKKSNIIDTSNNEITLTNDLVIKLLNDNKEMRDIIIKQQDHMVKQQEQISDLLPKIGNNNIQNNIQNNKFNIQVFLNEQCKDAINMSDFVKSIQVSLQQLDYIKHNGLVNGLSNVIIENMNKLGLYERPIHCTDIKRETLYIKDDDAWEKDINKDKIKKVIKDVSTKQFCALNNWTKENPDFQNNESKQNYYTHALVAIANNKENNEEKIIKKLCNNSYVKED